MQSRRTFLQNMSLVGAGLALSPVHNLFSHPQSKNWFSISLAQWSLHRTIGKGELKNIDFPAFAANEFDIHAVEYVSRFFKDEAKNITYLKDLNARAADHNVANVLIMVDGEGDLGDADASKRTKAVENHYQWIDAAQQLGCHAIRVNAAGKGTPDEVAKRVIDSLRTLALYGQDAGISVVVENHGGISSDGAWLSKVLKTVDHKNCGSLPDFGNFYEYDRYQGVKDLMPFAKGVSAKSNVFDAQGMEANIDYTRMMKIVRDAGYTGYVGIEYEGDKHSEIEGIKLTKTLLERFQMA
ncbi:sugar phosphate isomerase/epimerase [Sphingobacterium sp. lm-10]|uniref:sugar phosphate isomerase/epimerase family protein n=1 Tax=Sphingobacterium sp. lm-10 TaxID=2944904 RepID=UPI002021746C|nr:sugar phosphate isomerase/epimerase family protein [Sphingobacterium sp. lm-10]MCL7986766.1 sugar phosphate isomerase/epimerase [Sphingobacterium sp. lm-10]